MNAAGTEAKKILIIDDEAPVVRYLEALRPDNGYETVSAANGNEGLIRAREAKPDLICLDITMPENSGVRFCQELRHDPELQDIPVIVVTAVTGYGRDPEPFKKPLYTRSQFLPPEAFIAKPIVKEDFLASIAKLLSARRAA